jgi:acyl-homoserine-lactone acylase
MRRRNWWLVLSPVLLAPLLVALPGVPAPPAGANPNAVTVTIDSDGIPHIEAASFRALGYGEAWAFSRDDFCTLAEDFVTVNGERSRYFGPKGLSVTYAATTVDTNLQSDLFWQSIKQSQSLQSEMSQPPPDGPLPQIRDLYLGFIAGYNAYLASGQLHDPTCAGKPWVRPIGEEDMFLRGIQIATEASSIQFVADEADADPPAPAHPKGAVASQRGPEASAAPAIPSHASLVALGDKLRENATSTLGSNGIGIGAQDTANGDGMVLANPHFPWRGAERFWLAQLTVPGQYDAMGGTLYGFPLIGIGFNEDLAWTHTVSTSFHFTFYQLKLVPGHPTSYYVDGRVKKMGRVTVAVDTGKKTVRHTFYTTVWGRVLVVPQAAYKWTTTTAYAVDDANMSDTFRAANQFLAMGQSTSVAQLLAVESKYLAIPFFNTMAADDTGHALYSEVSNIPNVPKALITACLPTGAAQLVFAAAGVVTLTGSRSACAWRNDPGTPVKGIFDAAHLPHTIRTDYVENSNDSYWLANPSAPFPAFSPIVGTVDTQQDYRTRLGNQLIAERVAGTDGLGPPKFTLATLQKMWEGDESEEAALALTSLVAACRATPSAKDENGTMVDLSQACTALAGYDGTGHRTAHGGWLFSEWVADAPTTASLWSVPFNPTEPLTTPSGLNTASPAVLRALATAVLGLEAHHIPLDASYGQVQYAPQRGPKIPIPGCNTGCFNAIFSADGKGGPASAAPYGQVYTGSSLVMTTELTPHGPISQGILTYSEATDPTSPWYRNLTTLYSKGQWITYRFTPQQLVRDHGARTTTLTAPS